MSEKILIDALFANNIRVAHIKNDNLENYNFEVAGNTTIRGNIYLGKILRIENSLQAAFVDYGGEKNGFLSISEIHPDYFHLPLEEKQKLLDKIKELQDDTNGEGKELPAKELNKLYKSYNIASIVKVGQLVLVQGVKEERGNKGATLTTYISLPGRYCVYMTNTPNRNGISRKIHNISERQRIREIITKINSDSSGSIVVRTAGEEVSEEVFNKDYQYLHKIWSDIKKKTLSSQAPSLIHNDSSIIKSVIREYCTSKTDEIIVDGKTAFIDAQEILQNPTYKDLKLTKHNSRTPLFVVHKIEDQISQLLNPVVQMQSGASLVIQQTEALISIDVNSGRSTGEASVEETAVKTNKEAAWEIAKQLRLRNLSGLIVIDFIDMNQFSNRRLVEKEFKAAIENDRARIQILSISNFGLMEVSRQRTSPTLLETSGTLCVHCNGSGFTQSVEHSAMSALRQIISFINKSTKPTKRLQIEINAQTAMHILNYKTSLLKEIEDENSIKILFSFTEGNALKITDISKIDNNDNIFIAEKDWNPEEYVKTVTLSKTDLTPVKSLNNNNKKKKKKKINESAKKIETKPRNILNIIKSKIFKK